MSFNKTKPVELKIKIFIVGDTCTGKTSMHVPLISQEVSGGYGLIVPTPDVRRTEPVEDSLLFSTATIGVNFNLSRALVPQSEQYQSQLDYYITRSFEKPDHSSFPYSVPGQHQSNANQDINPPMVCRLMIWDCGKIDIHKNAIAIIPGSDCMIVCYDITDLDTWKHALKHMNTYKSLNPNALFILVGTKKDLILGDTPEKTRAVPVDEVRQYALENGFPVFEISAKLDTLSDDVDWVNELFIFIANEVVYRRSLWEADAEFVDIASPDEHYNGGIRVDKLS